MIGQSAQTATPQNQIGVPLTPADIASLEKSYLTPTIINAAQISRVDSQEGARIVGRKPSKAHDYAGLAIPNIWPGDARPREHRLRRDNPDLERKPDGSIKEKNKYLSPPGRGNLLYIPPDTPAEWLTDVSIPVTIVEGEKKALALLRFYTERGEKRLVIAVPGVWSWRGTVGKATNAKGRRQNVHGVISDFDRIEWKGREVSIVFDVNVATDDSVGAARRELAKELKRRGVVVRLLDLPGDVAGVNGIDDLLAIKGADFVAALFADLAQSDERAGATDAGKSLSHTLIKLALKDSELFHDAGGDCYASVVVGSHRETYRIGSRAHKDWLSRLLYEKTGCAARSETLNEAITVLRAKALYDGPKIEVHVRIAEHNGVIYLDLADNDWRQVEITESGWKIIAGADSPVRFVRSRGMLPLLEPVRGGSINDWHGGVNLPKQFGGGLVAQKEKLTGKGRVILVLRLRMARHSRASQPLQPELAPRNHQCLKQKGGLSALPTCQASLSNPAKSAP
jgi:hypothetical protein